MKLNVLEIANFRGIKSFRFEPQGRNAVITADNGVGKSTVVNAFIWLLTGKDASGSADSNIRCSYADMTDAKQTKRNPNVYAEFEDETGYVYALRREKKAAFSGVGPEKKYSGDLTQCYIDGQKATNKDYDKAVQEITGCDGNIAAFVSLYYITEQMSADERRKMLIAAFGELSDGEFAEKNGNAETIAVIAKADRRGVGAMLDKLKHARETEANSLKKIAGRIAETEREYAELDAMGGETETAERMRNIEAEIAAAEADAAALSNDAYIVKLRGRLADLRDKKQGLLSADDEFLQRASAEAVKKLQAANAKLRKIKADIDILTAKKVQASSDASAAKSCVMLYIEHESELTGDVFVPQANCPTCGAAIPEEKIAEARTRFNTTKAANIEKNARKMNEARATLENYEMLIEKINADIAAAKNTAAAMQTKVKKLKAYQLPEAPNAKSILDIEKKIDSTNEEIALAQKTSAPQMQKTQDAIRILRSEYAQAAGVMAAMERKKSILARLNETRELQKQTAANEAEILREIHILEKFIYDKAKYEEDSINAHFDTVKWKLFSKYANGNLKNACECYVLGVPYISVNRAGKVEANKDILRAMTKRLEVNMPLFVDDMDGVFVDLSGLPMQTIRTYAQKEPCPRCASENSEKTTGGKWVCQKCGANFNKKINWKFAEEE